MTPKPVDSETRERRIVRLLAVAAGISVANLYYAQPVAASMAASLHIGEASIGAAMMLSQVGYAVGMLVLVPLGDGRERRGLIVVTSMAASAALVLVATARTFAVFAVTNLVMGFASSVPQMIIPFAVGVVRPEARARTLGTVMGGLLGGILLSRTASGALGKVFGWRLTLGAAAILMALLAGVLRVALPLQHPETPLGWKTIVASLRAVVRSQPLLRKHALIGALGMASFSAFWSTLAFHLAAHGHGSDVAGAFGLIGVVGVIAAPVMGRVSGRVTAGRINIGSLLLVIVAFVILSACGAWLPAIAFAVVLLDLGVQVNHLANQTVIFGLSSELRNRINAVYMVSYFSGAATGTLTAAVAWKEAGWAGVCAAGAAFAAAGVARAAAGSSPTAAP